MKRIILPLLLALIGLGGGIGAGIYLRPPHGAAEVTANPCGDAGGSSDPGTIASGEGSGDASKHGGEGAAAHDYVKLNNQFIVPVVGTGKVSGLVVLSLSLEVKAGTRDTVFAIEPKLRDVFLQVLFDHANSGGFDGAFTDSNRLDVLRHSLLEAARKVIADRVYDVLITDIVRQET